MSDAIYEAACNNNVAPKRESAATKARLERAEELLRAVVQRFSEAGTFPTNMKEICDFLWEATP